ncbi:DciA family protein [Streptomyces sp. NPDC051183]|uniref:DciA family protein n=1 Tax=unclassified Streptomyces TaxID=2593676 RepID=UPI00342AEB63
MPDGGRDLARVVLQAARAAARAGRDPESAARGARAPGPAVPGGRDPHELGLVVAVVVAERAWDTALPSDGVLERWPAVVPELAGHVRAVAFVEAEGRLDLLPDSRAYAVQLGLTGDQLAVRLNRTLGGEVVRAIRVLSPSPEGVRMPPEGVRAPPEPAGPPDPARPAGPAPRSAGYLRALEAHRAARAGRRPG